MKTEILDDIAGQEIDDIYTSVESPESFTFGTGLVKATSSLDLLFPSYEAKFHTALKELKTRKALRLKSGKIEIKTGRSWHLLSFNNAPVTRQIVENVNFLLKSKKLGKLCIDANKAIRKVGCSILADETGIPRVLCTI